MHFQQRHAMNSITSLLIFPIIWHAIVIVLAVAVCEVDDYKMRLTSGLCNEFRACGSGTNCFENGSNSVSQAMTAPTFNNLIFTSFVFVYISHYTMLDINASIMGKKVKQWLEYLALAFVICQVAHCLCRAGDGDTTLFHWSYGVVRYDHIKQSETE